MYMPFSRELVLCRQKVGKVAPINGEVAQDVEFFLPLWGPGIKVNTHKRRGGGGGGGRQSKEMRATRKLNNIKTRI